MLRIAYGNQWKTINPGLQHTLVGDLVIGNQFESLVGLDDNGAVAPLGAKSWTVSPDFREYRFQIDRSKKFSNGEPLSAKHYKRSWEKSALMAPMSHNASSQDVLYMIEGFERLHETNEISGINAENDEELVIKFVRPYRMALEHLEGNRFAAFIERDGKYLGTGRYLISEIGADHLQFTLNKTTSADVSRAAEKIDVTVASGAEGLEKLANGQIDVLAYGIGTQLAQELPSQVRVVIGQDAVRHCLQLNSHPNRIFASRENRSAFQFLMRRILSDHPEFLGNSKYSKIDFQLYLELQAGRISPKEVDDIIATGAQHLKSFLEETQKHPLIVFLPAPHMLLERLQEYGVKLSERSRVVPKDEYFRLMYTSIEPDVFMSAFSVAYGDPDGIYHKLGPSGAIASAMVLPGKTAALLEQGRALFVPEEISPFYQEVSRTFLHEVPIVHLGYSKAIALYRQDRVTVGSTVLKRNEGLLHIFEVK